MMQDRRAQLIVFDLDGTLLNTMPAFGDIAGTILHDLYGIDSSAATLSYLATSGRPFCEQIELIVPGGEHNRRAVLQFEQSKASVSAGASMPEVVRCTLVELQRRGKRLTISSNNSQEVVDLFAAQSPVHFELSLGFKEHGKGKGDAHFQELECQFGCQRREMIFVGDSLHDAELALAAGVSFIAILGTFDREKFQQSVPGCVCIDRFDELLKLV